VKKTLGHHALMHDGEKFIDTWSKDLDTSDDALITEDLKIYHAIKDLKLAQLGEPALWNIAGRLGLVDLLKYFFEHNKSTAEYHSNYHAICVALNCYEGAWHQKLSESETKTVVLAGIFHDFNHSGGTFSDDENIKRAVLGLSQAHIPEVRRSLSSNYKPNLLPDEFEQTVQTLVITKYPFEKEPVTIMEQIIRDADLMQPYEQDDKVLKNQYHGLLTEIERTYPMKFTANEFAAGQLSWLNDNVTWYSDWGKNKALKFNWNVTKQRLFEIMSR
jgi:hypothetical protein